MSRLAILSIFFTLLVGCDAAAPEPAPARPDVIGGTLTSLTTGAPLVGVAVELTGPGAYLSYPVYGLVTTDADGRFSLDAREANRQGAEYSLTVNGPTKHDLQVPPDERLYRPLIAGWNSGGTSAASGGGVPLTADMEIAVAEYAELVVYATPEVPLGEGDRAFVSTPCVGSIDVPTRSGCALANTANTVTLIVTRDGVETTRAERIYTPLGETTVVRWTY